MCELYDDLNTLTLDQVLSHQKEQIAGKEAIDVVKLSKCASHFFHKQCVIGLQGKNDYLKCPVCSKIYGTQTGNMPPGIMSWRLHAPGRGSLSSFESYGTYEINYQFRSGTY